MGIYINKGNGAFARARRSEYIDKSGLIAVVNKSLFTRESYTCVTRSRRFGKTMAAEMLAAYYDKSCDLVLQPRKHIDKPAIIVELKYNTAVDTAIDQIHERRYPEKVAEYKGDILLVGISYDKKAKTHQCKMERINK